MKKMDYVSSLSSGFTVAALALAVATILVWRNSINGGLWADDTIYLLFAREASLKGLLNIWLLKEEYLRDYWMQYVSFTGGEAPDGGGLAAYWRPVTNLITALDVRLWGDWHAGYHLTNIFGHFLVALALRRVSLKLGFSPLWALGISIFWMALPAHGTTVSWISARHDIFAALFALLSFDSYLSWRNKPQNRKIVSGSLLYLLALGCKAIVLPLPGVILIHALFIRNGTEEQSRNRNRIPPELKSLLYWFAPFMLISLGMYLLMVYWPIPDGFSRITDDCRRIFLNRNPWMTFVLPIQYIFQFLFGVMPFDLEAMPWPAFALSAGVFIWWTIFLLLAVFRRDTAFVTGVSWFFLMVFPLLFTIVGTHYVYSATPGGALAVAALLRKAMLRPLLWKKVFAGTAAAYMFCFWSFSSMFNSAWYSFLPQANEIILKNLKKTVPALEDRQGRPYRKIYIFNAWSMIHHMGYLVRLEYGRLDIPVRILTIDPEYFPKDLEMPPTPQTAWLAGMLAPLRSERRIDYKLVDKNTIDVIRRERGMFNTMLERKVLLDAGMIKAGKTWLLDTELGPRNSYSARIEENLPSGLPARIRFRFEHPLDDPGTLFLLQQGSHFIRMDFGNGFPERAQRAR